VSLSTSFKESRRQDRWGNEFRLRSEAIFGPSSVRGMFDVYPVFEGPIKDE
jgi:hypothetical protein